MPDTYGKEIISEISRRKRIGKDLDTSSSQMLTPVRVIEPSLFAIAWRMLFWIGACLRFGLGVCFDSLRRKNSIWTRASRFRGLLQQIGPTAIKLGQQLSLRTDLLPSEYCDELMGLLDDVPDFPKDEAIRIFEESTGKRLDSVFSNFDPVPIGSASLACVYQAQLLNGELAAVKIRRPNIDHMLKTDLDAILAIVFVLDKCGMSDAENMRLIFTEVRRAVTEELDFKQEARYTETFRRDSKVIKYVSAPRVYHEYSTDRVMVSEFVSGIFLNEILATLDSQDHEMLDQLKASGYNFKTIARRMQQIFFWEVFEGHFFHADPHPANLIVRPDNTIVMIDFGSCGRISKSYQRNMVSFFKSLTSGDLNRASELLLAGLEPLPPVDVVDFLDDIVDKMTLWFYALTSTHSAWHEKCAASFWIMFTKLCRKHQVPARRESTRFFRATFLYDSIIYRIYPQLDLVKEFGRWEKAWSRRNRKSVALDMSRWLLEFQDVGYPKLQHLQQVTERVLDRVELFAEKPRYSYSLAVGKVAYAVSRLVRYGLATVLFTFLATSAVVVCNFHVAEAPLIGLDLIVESAKTVVMFPLYPVIFFLIMPMIAIHKILRRMNTFDVDKS